ncbi:hypothetical protein DTO021D3_1639 [Paecilomyces variotii]|nr:hypothetical protein DTO032I3_1491 [Paecilomyces variotii]KAJ9281416.1 hypothetical protein DTO021D3_1639 [Paecilomyces variotii]KAJ9290433.1 hypothetical protein DTO021C3_2057 [Paecilomyces variotii]KAJ9346675.1 hypothetical protein DTO027B6_929 [Paecilomyces variotii]KAJ9391120.1 hypothetical protein DTO032I4_1476 [Paecilomyces variotii]
MRSPPKPYYRQPPPVKPSKSLEGLEVVVPPGTFFISQSDISVDILNKPLPAKPLPETPERSSSLSSQDSLLETFIYRTSTETTDDSHIPVASDPYDYSTVLTRPATAGALSTRPSLGQLSRDKVSSLSLKAFMTQERFGGDIHARIKAGPYFREKKFDFFPELATPSGLQAATYSGRSHGLKRRLRGRKSPVSLPASLEFGRSGSRWLSSENKALLLGHGIRDSIRSCMQKTASRKKSHDQKTQRPNVKSNHPYAQRGAYHAVDSKSLYEDSESGLQQNFVDVYHRMRTLPISPGTSSGSSFSSSRSRTLVTQSSRQQLYPTESYEDYGFKAGGDLLLYRRASYSKGSNDTVPRHPRRTSSMIEMRQCTCINPTPPLTQPRSTQLQQQTQQYVKALHSGTSQMISALDGAKKKLMETRADRRRAELKKQIKMVGPVDPWRHAGVNYLL